MPDLPKAVWGAVLEAAQARFTKRNRYGVHSFALGHRVKNGRPLAETTLNVFVVRKLLAPKNQVPTIEVVVAGRHYRITPNVIATGRRPRAHEGALFFSGVHAGAGICTRGNFSGSATIAALVTTGGPATHFLTCGHLFPLAASGTEADVFAAVDDGSPLRKVGRVVANYLDSDDVDASLVELTATGSGMIVPFGPSLTTVVPESGVRDKTVRAFLMTTNDYSRQAQTEDHLLSRVFLSSPQRGTFAVENVIATNGEVTNPGDSGTVLCMGANNERAAGICCGVDGMHSVFEPFERALSLATATVGGSLSLA